VKSGASSRIGCHVVLRGQAGRLVTVRVSV
jgi:hypothetical protein